MMQKYLPTLLRLCLRLPLAGSGSQPQPSREMLFCGPFAQVSSYLTDDLQDAVVGECGQYRQILALTQNNEHSVKAGDLRRIGAGSWTPSPNSQSRNWCNWLVNVPKTFGRPPAMETYICSPRTSQKAARESRTGNSFITNPLLHLQISKDN